MFTFEKYMTENPETFTTYIDTLENFDIIKFIWGKNSDYIKSKGIKPADIDDNILKLGLKIYSEVFND